MYVQLFIFSYSYSRLFNLRCSQDTNCRGHQYRKEERKNCYIIERPTTPESEQNFTSEENNKIYKRGKLNNSMEWSLSKPSYWFHPLCYDLPIGLPHRKAKIIASSQLVPYCHYWPYTITKGRVWTGACEVVTPLHQSLKM